MRSKARSKDHYCRFSCRDHLEKKALALYLDGRVSAVIGTHTHVATADEQILKGGTAFITDVGMTGVCDGSIIGMNSRLVTEKFVRGVPVRFEPALEILS